MNKFCDYCGEHIKESERCHKMVNHEDCQRKEKYRLAEALQRLSPFMPKKTMPTLAVNVQSLYGTTSIAAISKKHKKFTRDTKLRELSNKVSAIMNSGGGTILIHIVGMSCDETYIGAFDEFADEKLHRLISDGSLFTDVFTRERLDHHHGFEKFHDMMLLHVNASQSLITADSKTKMSLDNCIITPCDGVIRTFLMRKKQFKTSHPKEKATLRELELLSESRAIQCKAWMHDDELNENSVKEFIVRFRLCEYVSAFTKLENGGSIYLGIGERQSLKGHYVSRSVDIHGILLHDREKVKKILQEELISGILVCDYEGNVIEVSDDFIKVHDIAIENRVVLQISAPAVSGIVFYDKSGPQAYRLNTNGNLEQIPLSDWFSCMTQKHMDS